MKMEQSNQRNSGFSLLELLVAMALGLLLLGSASQLFTSGMNTTTIVANRSEMQQNARSALDLVAKDISMAGAGLPVGGIQLPTGTNATLSQFACDQSGTCYRGGNTYPVGVVGTAAPFTTVNNFMFGIIPGPQLGMETTAGQPTVIAATNRIPDSITVAYRDFAFPLDLFTGTMTPTGKILTLTAPAVLPSNFQNAINPSTGLQVGDLLMITTAKGTAVGEVSTAAALATTGATVTFASADPLNINQFDPSSTNNLYTVSKAAAATVVRIFVVTYFVEVPVVGTPRLMRQVNGNAPQPVADNIIDLQLNYDMCDTVTTAACANVANPFLGAMKLSPNQIHKVNIQLMTQSLVTNGKNAQNMQLSTAVSARNLNYKDTYQ